MYAISKLFTTYSTRPYGLSAHIERTIKAQSLRRNSITPYILSKKTMEVNPKHSIITELKIQAVPHESDHIIMNLIWMTYALTV